MLNCIAKYLFSWLGVFLFCTYTAAGQDSLIVSLKQQLKKAASLEEKVDLYIDLCVEYRRRGEYKKAFNVANKGMLLVEEENYSKGRADILLNIGTLYGSQGNYEQAKRCFRKSIAIYKTLGDSLNITIAYTNLGIVHKKQGHYAKALKYYFARLSFQNKMENRPGVFSLYNNIAGVYVKQKEYDKALKYLNKCLDIARTSDDPQKLALVYGNIGNIHLAKNNFRRSYQLMKKSLRLRKKLGHKNQVSQCYSNLGRFYTKVAERILQQDTAEQSYEFPVQKPVEAYFDSALYYQKKGLQLKKEMGNKHSICASLNGLGDIYLVQSRLTLLPTSEKSKLLNRALQCYKKSASLADSIGALKQQAVGHENMVKVLERQQKFREANHHLKKISQLKKKMATSKQKQEIGRLEASHKWEKKMLKQRQKATVRSQQQKMYMGFIGGGLLLIASIAGLIYYRLRTTRKQRDIISRKNRQLNQANQAIAHKNKAITDSINYAQRIQQAVLVPEKEIKKQFPDSFVLLKPQSIVSGDFYYFSVVNNKTIIGVIDCTGHGVPGAFMSLIGNNLLNQIVRDQKITQPSEILNQLDQQLEQALRQETALKNKLGMQEQDFVRDGMDLALCVWNHKNKELHFAGANNPLYIVSGSRLKVKASKIKTFQPDNLQPSNLQLYELSPDKQPIGKRAKKKRFSKSSVNLKKGDRAYMFSDGYPDQFGGPKGKKFMYKRFRELLLDIQDQSMEKQKKILNQTIEDWMTQNNEEQIDDICVVGMRV